MKIIHTTRAPIVFAKGVIDKHGLDNLIQWKNEPDIHNLHIIKIKDEFVLLHGGETCKQIEIHRISNPIDIKKRYNIIINNHRKCYG